MDYDYLIVGQGIAGSVIGLQLLEQNKKCLFIDEKIWNSPSRISNGIVNPVTGQKYVNRCKKPKPRSKSYFKWPNHFTNA